MPIDTYKPGPTASLPQEPPPFVVPRMSQVTVPEKPAVWRVREADFAELQWLPERLAEDHPRLNVGGLYSWMRGAINDRMTLFIRTENIVGLFAAEVNVLDPGRPIVSERWVRSRIKDNDQAVLLYRFVRDWAKSIGSHLFEYARDSDCSMVQHVNSGLSDIRQDCTLIKSSVYAIRIGD